MKNKFYKILQFLIVKKYNKKKYNKKNQNHHNLLKIKIKKNKIHKIINKQNFQLIQIKKKPNLQLSLKKLNPTQKKTKFQ